MKKRIGILGGTFNPIHIGHLLLAQTAYDDFKLDKVMFIPTGISYFKNNQVILDKEIRYQMVNDAISDNPAFISSSVEIDRPGNTYTVDTLHELHKQYSDTDFYLIIGADSLCQIDQWKDFEEIFKLATILVAVRDDTDKEKLKDISQKLTENYSAKIEIMESANIEISSSNIRERIRTDKSIKYMVSDATYKYIEANNLYKSN
ncbi:MAG: nicotinate-nucleotide adenylyltransferase [Lachnospiraceae bacterium]|nr:nicotinate-nucleotide adenylyltransferase [Candidatus Colinaster equi]